MSIQNSEQVSGSAFVSGGMTVALKDVILLTQILSPFLQVSSSRTARGPGSQSAEPGVISVDWDEMRETLREWHWSRKAFSTTINILSVALYDLFGANGIAVPHIDFFSQLTCCPIPRTDVDLDILRDGCFAYFERGGDCTVGPVSLLSGLVVFPLAML